jgi:hypothetical protein
MAWSGSALEDQAQTGKSWSGIDLVEEAHQRSRRKQHLAEKKLHDHSCWSDNFDLAAPDSPPSQ